MLGSEHFRELHVILHQFHGVVEQLLGQRRGLFRRIGYGIDVNLDLGFGAGGTDARPRAAFQLIEKHIGGRVIELGLLVFLGAQAGLVIADGFDGKGSPLPA